MKKLIRSYVKTTIVLHIFMLVMASASMWHTAGTPPWNDKRPEMKHDPRNIPGYEPMVYDSSHSFDVRFYDLHIYTYMTGPEFFGTVNILNTSNQANLNTISLNCVELVVDSVLVDGSPATYDTNQNKINITLGPYALGQDFEVFVGYHGIANTIYGGGAFPAGFSYFPRTFGAPETTAYSMAEPTDARKWFPCFDEPWDKADSSKISVTLPNQYQVASNGLLISVDSVSNRVTYTWSETFPIATYLMSIAISKYAILHDEYVSPSNDTTPIMHFVYHADSAQAVAGYQNVPEMVAFYSDTFGEYPFEKYGMAVVEPFGGGMEHQTMTTILAYYTWEMGIAHELAHMWWGDMITCADWPNIWLNEGFATYTEALWVEHSDGELAFRSEVSDLMDSYFDQANYFDFPIYDPPPSELFNWGIIYCKAACIVHMLRYVLGETGYWQMMPTYADSFQYGVANTPDLQRICEQVYGENMDWFFQQWVYDLGYPRYEYGWRSVDLGGSQYRLDVQVRQVQTSGPDVFRMPLEFRFGGTGIDTTLTGVDSLEFQEFSFVVDLPSAPTTMSFDFNNWIIDYHYQVPYNGISDDNGNDIIPTEYQLGQNYPNPMKTQTRIDFAIPQPTHVNLTIYNTVGQKIIALLDQDLNPGFYNVNWNGYDQRGLKASAGVYFYAIEASTFSATKRLIIVK